MTILKGFTLATNCTVVPGISFNEGGFVGAGSVLTKSCKAWALMVGVPARQVGWVSAYGEKIPIELSGSGQWTFAHTGDVYKINGYKLHRGPEPIDNLSYTLGRKLDQLIQTGSGSR